MSLYKDFLNKLILAIVASSVSSLSILVCIFVGENEVLNTVLKIVFPLIFWIGLILEQVFISQANKMRLELEKKDKRKQPRLKPGVISIFQTEEGAKADITFAVSFLILIILMIFDIGTNVLQYIFIFLSVLTFRMHCILNGKNFRYKKFFSKRKVENDVNS